MTFPPDLPGILYYRVGGVILTTLPRRPVVYVSSSGATNAAVVRPTIPLGCDAWRADPSGPWLKLDQLPAAWLPFLNRPRNSEMDPRPEAKGKT
jgi:hypothetical protein